jgi:uncharacterized protein with von Willebrand factor type A (vWA) domain
MFTKFENLGQIADRNKRKKMAKNIFDELHNSSENKIALSDAETDNFGTSINQIISNKNLKELCENDAELSEKITQEILNFITKTQKEIVVNDSLSSEYELLDLFEKITEKQFIAQKDKHILTPFFKELNARFNEIDTVFYQKELYLSIDENRENKPSFDSVKAHLSDKWKALLFKKETAFQLNLIDEKRQLFCEELHEKVNELRALKIVLSPFAKQLGRFWDMSIGHWQHLDFAILKHYANLFKNDKALNQLTEMLGKMQETERTIEAKMVANHAFEKAEWTIVHAQKSDLVGVHESDDLSSLLPSETAFLSDSILQNVFFKKFAEKKLQTFQYQSNVLINKDLDSKNKNFKTKENAKGPIIICVDTSGSMQGTPEIVAKTLCFAMLKMAIQQNRKCFLISFSTQIQTLDLTDFAHAMEKLLQFLAMSFYGGTEADPSVSEALKQLETANFRRADVLMISDFVMPSFDEITKQKIKKAKENKTKFHSLVIGKSQNKRLIADFDNNWVYDPNNAESMLTLVQNLKKIK